MKEPPERASFGRRGTETVAPMFFHRQKLAVIFVVRSEASRAVPDRFRAGTACGTPNAANRDAPWMALEIKRRRRCRDAASEVRQAIPRTTEISRSRIFLRNVFRFRPSIAAALIWLPRVAASVIWISGRSTSASTSE